MKKRIIINLLILVLFTLAFNSSCPLHPSNASRSAFVFDLATDDNLIFIHHSCGRAWLDNSLHNALLAKDYIDERNDMYYGDDILPDSGRPDSLGPTPGDCTNMNHWILWFNDYLGHLINHDCEDGINRIIMFKSCYPISNITGDGTEPGDPFSSSQTLVNYKAVYRHPNGPGHTYSHGGYTYKPLFDVFAENPDILFIPVTAPPRHYAPTDATNDAEAHRARLFNEWLKQALDAYNTAHPGLNNVAVFDWFDVLAYPDYYTPHPNRLKYEYGGASGNSHPNSTANADSTAIFATDPDNFIDAAWEAFLGPPPSLDIKANGSDGPISLSYGEALTLTLDIEPGAHEGEDADWWVVVKTPFSPPNEWYYYDLSLKTWMQGRKVTSQNPLFDMDPKNLPVSPSLQPGTYFFFFAVDLVMNGSIDMGEIYFNKVRVTINP
jgi:hypothetical protein